MLGIPIPKEPRILSHILEPRVCQGPTVCPALLSLVPIGGSSSSRRLQIDILTGSYNVEGYLLSSFRTFFQIVRVRVPYLVVDSNMPQIDALIASQASI